MTNNMIFVLFSHLLGIDVTSESTGFYLIDQFRLGIIARCE